MFQKKVVEKIKTHILCSVTLFENRVVYEKKWKHFVERESPHMIIWRIRLKCWTSKAKNTHTQVVLY